MIGAYRTHVKHTYVCMYIHSSQRCSSLSLMLPVSLDNYIWLIECVTEIMVEKNIPWLKHRSFKETGKRNWSRPTRYNMLCSSFIFFARTHCLEISCTDCIAIQTLRLFLCNIIYKVHATICISLYFATCSFFKQSQLFVISVCVHNAI